jgi:hypothetical protein
MLNSIFRNSGLQLKFKCVKMEKSKQIKKMKKMRYPIVIILASLILINAFVTYSSCNYRLYGLATTTTTAAESTTNTAITPGFQGRNLVTTIPTEDIMKRFNPKISCCFKMIFEISVC